MERLLVEDDPQGCPRCKTLLSANPRLELRYSTCCGIVMCTSCIRFLFASGRRTNCFECGNLISRDDFSTHNLSRQKYEYEIKLREKLSNIFSLTTKEFKTETEYEDYLEFQQDVLYNLIYGTKSEVRIAEKQISEFKKVYENIIKQSMIHKMEITPDIQNYQQQSYSVDFEKEKDKELAKLAGGFNLDADFSRSDFELGISLWIILKSVDSST